MATQLNIKSDEARALAEELARRSGGSITDAVIAALRDRVARVRYAQSTVEQLAKEKEDGFYALIEGSRALWKDYVLSLDHADLLYDEWGLPR